MSTTRALARDPSFGLTGKRTVESSCLTKERALECISMQVVIVTRATLNKVCVVCTDSQVQRHESQVFIKSEVPGPEYTYAVPLISVRYYESFDRKTSVSYFKRDPTISDVKVSFDCSSGNQCMA